jgi:hypothetical protein
MAHNARVAWIVAGVLGFIVLVLLIYIGSVSSNDNLGSVLDEGRSTIGAERQEIRERCADNINSSDCQEALEELTDILRAFNRDLTRAGVPAPEGTSSETAP